MDVLDVQEHELRVLVVEVMEVGCGGGGGGDAMCNGEIAAQPPGSCPHSRTPRPSAGSRRRSPGQEVEVELEVHLVHHSAVQCAMLVHLAVRCVIKCSGV